MTLPLTHRQWRFVHEYMIDQNASAAAVRAGYSAKSKGAQAAELMKNERVMEQITIGLGALFAQLNVNALRLLQEQVDAAFFDPAKLFGPDEEPLPIEALDAHTRSALTVSYRRRIGSPAWMTVKQTPKHVALAALVKRFDLLQKMQMEMGARERAREGEGAVAGTGAMPAAAKGAMRAGLTPPLLPGQWRPPIDEPHWVREARELITSHAAEVARMPAGSPVQAAQAALALRMAQEELSGHLSEGDKERMVMRHAQEIREVRAARVAEVPESQAPAAAQVAPAQGASNKPGEDVSRAGGARTAAVSEKAVPERKGRVARRRPAEMIPVTSNVVEKHRGFGGSWDAKTNCGLRKTELGSE